MRSNKATFNVRLRRARNVYQRVKHLLWRLRRGAANTQKELQRLEQLQRVIAKGYLGYFGRVPSVPNLQSGPDGYAEGYAAHATKEGS